MAEPPGLEAVRRALAEDRAAEDVTTQLLGRQAASRMGGRFRAQGRFVVAGLSLAELAFRELDPAAAFTACVSEGEEVESGAVLATVEASARALLGAERVALNFLQRLSAIATATRAAVRAVAGTGARITHTRKTTPGLRAIERYAVSVGGGVENRGSLAEAVFWKDNHWELLERSGRRLAEVLAAAPAGLPVIVEAETDAQFEEALAAGVTHIVADNQPPERIAQWARRAGPGVTIQASGGITPATARAYAVAGASLISMGALTHSVCAAPIGFEVVR
ncbi:MAG TPA: carboxylating nicotinate-nucleotide diphosphorylase [Gemmatimonadales bacterium]|nr:carboxylating nicotinate-nucleotide diphosphorylase [Gemmatimonadales bacterium]